MRPLSAMRELTICTVSFHHGQYLGLNVRLVEAMNELVAERVKWLIADNAPVDTSLRSNCPQPFVVIRNGLAGHPSGASYHHAVSLNALLKEVKTRYLLVLDPDFYIVRHNWINLVLEHMEQRKLAFFGVPWHPRYERNYRYFPAVHCMFVDTQRVPAAELDFCPILERMKHRNSKNLLLLSNLINRKRIPWDTGVRIFDQFGKDAKYSSECLTMVCRPSQYAVPASLKLDLIESILPDSYCYRPKARNRFSVNGFKELGLCSENLPDLWEEILWGGSPFGLHVRRSFNSKMRDDDSEIMLLQSVLKSLSGGIDTDGTK